MKLKVKNSSYYYTVILYRGFGVCLRLNNPNVKFLFTYCPIRGQNGPFRGDHHVPYSDTSVRERDHPGYCGHSGACGLLSAGSGCWPLGKHWGKQLSGLIRVELMVELSRH